MSCQRTDGVLLELQEQFLECPVCTEIFDEDKHLPYVIPCHHTFCRNCLRKISKKSSLKCPTCNEIHHIKKETTKFPKDNTRRDLKSFVDSLQSEKASRVVKCYVCKSCPGVYLFCMHCNVYLCYLCKNFHSTENNVHSLLQNSNDCNLGILDHCFNQAHHNLPLVYYCESTNCGVVLCAICVVENHRDLIQHSVCHIKEALDRKQGKLKNNPRCNTMSDLLKNLEEQFLECAICTEIFDEDKHLPYVIPCNHTFCIDCLRKILTKSSLKCPTCNEEHHIIKETSKFPKDNTRRDLKSFVDSVQLEETSQVVKCSRCKSCSEAFLFCMKCDIYLCNVCKIFHTIENDVHWIVQKTNNYNPCTLDVCFSPTHFKAPLVYYCESADCEILLCPICVVENHKDPLQHDVYYIDEAFVRQKSRLRYNVKLLEKKVAIYSTYFCISILVNKMNEITERCVISNQTFLEHIRKIEHFIVNTTECLYQANALEREPIPTEFFKSNRTTDKRIQELLNAHFDFTDVQPLVSENTMRLQDKHSKLRVVFRRFWYDIVSVCGSLKRSFQNLMKRERQKLRQGTEIKTIEFISVLIISVIVIRLLMFFSL